MRKVLNWLSGNKKEILIGVTSFATCFALISSLWAAKSAIDRYENDKLKSACLEAYSVMCVQVHACKAGSVANCDTIVRENALCEKPEVLPNVEVIDACKEELRHIECEGNLPGTCQTFME